MPNSPIAISALSAAVTLAAGDLLLVVAAGTTSKMTPANLLASLDLYHGPIRRRAGGGVVYNHTDLATAVAAMAAGQSLELDPGVFALGTTQLVMPANVTIRGSGAVGPLHWGNTANMDGTIITFAGTEAGQGCGIVPGSNNYFENLSMVATDVQGCPFGCTTVGSQQGGLGVVVRGCYIFGGYDATIFSRSGGTRPVTEVSFFNCVLEGNYDGVIMNGATNSTINLYDCTVNLSATNWGTSSASIRVLGCAANTRINAYNSKLSILTGNPTKNSIVAAGAGTITVANCGMYFPAGAAQGAHFVSGGTVRATSCYTIDGAAIVGTPSATSLISDLFITTTLNPKDADPASRPIAPAAGMLCFYTGKLYVCVDATTPAWELVTSA